MIVVTAVELYSTPGSSLSLSVSLGLRWDGIGGMGWSQSVRCSDRKGSELQRREQELGLWANVESESTESHQLLFLWTAGDREGTCRTSGLTHRGDGCTGHWVRLWERVGHGTLGWVWRTLDRDVLDAALHTFTHSDLFDTHKNPSGVDQAICYQHGRGKLWDTYVENGGKELTNFIPVTVLFCFSTLDEIERLELELGILLSTGRLGSDKTPVD